MRPKVEYIATVKEILCAFPARLRLHFCDASLYPCHTCLFLSLIHYLRREDYLLLPSPLPILTTLRNIQPQALRVQVDLVIALLQNRSNVPGILKLSQVNVAAALLDRVSDQFGGTGFTLGADHGRLFLLAGFVDDEGGALGFLLGYLFRFHCGRELGGECEMLSCCQWAASAGREDASNGA